MGFTDNTLGYSQIENMSHNVLNFPLGITEYDNIILLLIFSLSNEAENN